MLFIKLDSGHLKCSLKFLLLVSYFATFKKWSTFTRALNIQMWIGVCVWGIEVKLCNGEKRQRGKRGEEKNNVKTMKNGERTGSTKKKFHIPCILYTFENEICMFEWRNGERKTVHTASTNEKPI